MKITTRFIYGLKFLEYIYNSSGSVKMKDASEHLFISKKYLEKISRDLQGKNIIITIRGPQGGYMLNRDFKKFTAFDLYNALEGEIASGKCFENNDCIIKSCNVKNFLEDINSEIKNILLKKRIVDIFKGESL